MMLNSTFVRAAEVPSPTGSTVGKESLYSEAASTRAPSPSGNSSTSSEGIAPCQRAAPAESHYRCSSPAGLLSGFGIDPTNELVFAEGDSVVYIGEERWASGFLLKRGHEGKVREVDGDTICTKFPIFGTMKLRPDELSKEVRPPAVAPVPAIAPVAAVSPVPAVAPVAVAVGDISKRTLGDASQRSPVAASQWSPGSASSKQSSGDASTRSPGDASQRSSGDASQRSPGGASVRSPITPSPITPSQRTLGDASARSPCVNGSQVANRRAFGDASQRSPVAPVQKASPSQMVRPCTWGGASVGSPAAAPWGAAVASVAATNAAASCDASQRSPTGIYTHSMPSAPEALATRWLSDNIGGGMALYGDNMAEQLRAAAPEIYED